MDLVVSLVHPKTMVYVKYLICFNAVVLLCVFPIVRCHLHVFSVQDTLISLQKYFRARCVTFIYTENLKTNGEYFVLILYHRCYYHQA